MAGVDKETPYTMAKDMEGKLMSLLGQNVLVLSKNISFLTLEEVSPQEVAALLAKAA